MSPSCCVHYVDRAVDTEGLPFRRFSVAAQNRLRNYPWPDNVRELRTLVHRLLIQGGQEEIRLEEIERELAVQAPQGEPLVKQDLPGPPAPRSAASNSSAPTFNSSSSCAMERSGSWRNGWGWNAPTSTASSARSESTSGTSARTEARRPSRFGRELIPRVKYFRLSAQ